MPAKVRLAPTPGLAFNSPSVEDAIFWLLATMLGTCRVEDFLYSQSRLNRSLWAFPQFARLAPTFQKLKRFRTYGRTQVSTELKRGKSRCNGHLPIFDDFWTTAMLGSTIGPTVASMPPDDAELLKRRVRARLPADVAGRITYGALANAAKGGVSI